MIMRLLDLFRSCKYTVFHREDTIPIVKYTYEENEVWETLYKYTKFHNQKHACAEYKKWFNYLNPNFNNVE